MMPLTLLVSYVTAHLHAHLETARRDRHEHPERGDIVTTVIMISLFAAAAIIICGILIIKATSAANNVQTQ